ncbi:MAG TPA: D-alanyl-D-alanine carboxypeptidase [Streptomyces sp.]|nr:D-alanyl-D-alanine carboxypeptidase [Streptomyces sp.]
MTASTTDRARRTRRARGLTAATTAILVPCLLAGAPAAGTSTRPAEPAKVAEPVRSAKVPGAAAATVDEDPGESGEPRPPADMSTVGGERLGLPGVQIQPRAGSAAPGPPEGISARSWIVADAETGDVLAAKNAHWPLPPASTLKMLFADTLLPKFDKNAVHKVTREELEDVGPGSSMVGVKEDLTYTVHDLWLGVFLRSGNDAVHVLSAMNGGRDKTVREMNEHARELGAADTHVVSPDGYDADGQVSSAYDLTLIARSGMQKPDFREYAATVRAQFPGEEKKSGKNGKDRRETFEIQNTNRLLTGDRGLDPYEGIAGVKNGYTSKAGFTFTGVAQRGDRVLLATVMHPEQGGLRVYRETADLLDWGFEAADSVEPVGELVPPRGVLGEGAGSGKNPDKNPDGHPDGTAAGTSTAADAHGPSGGAGTALVLVVTVLAVLGAGAYGVHRRWPLPNLSGLGRGPGGPGGESGSGELPRTPVDGWTAVTAKAVRGAKGAEGVRSAKAAGSTETTASADDKGSDQPGRSTDAPGKGA